jgi:aminoglycoside 3-N-acetyltransferase
MEVKSVKNEINTQFVTKAELECGLNDLGLSKGIVVEVHSSLSAFGQVEGGARTVIDALIDVVGQQGTILMSAYPVTPPRTLSQKELERGIQWKVKVLPADSVERTGMGIISDTFKRCPDVVCGHGLHRVCAWGHGAAIFSRGYQQLVDADGEVLLLGIDIHRCSSLHLAEDVKLPQPILALSDVPDDILRDYDPAEWDIGYGGPPDDAWEKVFVKAERAGLVRQQNIGQAKCLLFKAKAMIEIYRQWRRDDPYGLFGVEPGD